MNKMDSKTGKSPHRKSQESVSGNESRRKRNKPKKGTLRAEFYIKGKKFQVNKTTLQTIKYLQRSTNLLIPKLPFARLVREILQESSFDSLLMQVKAFEALQESSEIYLTHLFEDANMLAMHARRITLKVDDIALALRMREKNK